MTSKIMYNEPMPGLSSPIVLIKNSLQIFFKKENLIFFLKIYSPFIFIGMVSLFAPNLTDSDFEYDLSPTSIGLLITGIIGYIIGLWAQVSGYIAVKKVIGGESLGFVEVYKTSWRKIFGFFGVSLLYGLGTVFGLILLVIPGIVFAVFYSFSFFNFINGEGVIQSMKSSKAIVTGRFWPVFGRVAVFLVFAVLVQIVFSFVPQIGPMVLSLFGAIFIIPNYLLYKELRA